MTFAVPLAPSAGAKSTDYPCCAVYGAQSGSDIVFHTSDDFYSAGIPPAIGANLFEGSAVLPAHFLGMHASASFASRLAPGIARNHDVAPRWSTIHTAAGTFVDSGLGAWLSANKAVGSETIYTIFSTPTWASARPGESANQYGVMGGKAEPSDMAYIEQFVTWLMTNYGDQIDYIEVWNEPKYDNTAASYFSGTPTKLAEIARRINLTAKAIKPSVQILGVGCTGITDNSPGGGIDWTNRFLSALDETGVTHGRDWIDVLSVHAYVHDGKNTLSLLDPVKGYLDTTKASNGVSSMPLWCTEFGYITPALSAYTGPVDARVRMLVRYAMYLVAMNVERAVAYAYGTGAMGWGVDSVGDAEWNRWASILNGSTVTRINRIGGAGGQLACVIDGVGYLV